MVDRSWWKLFPNVHYCSAVNCSQLWHHMHKKHQRFAESVTNSPNVFLDIRNDAESRSDPGGKQLLNILTYWTRSTMYYDLPAPLASSPDTRRQTVGRPKSVITHNLDPSCFTSLMSNPVIRLTTCTIPFVRTLPLTFTLLPMMKELAPDTSDDL